MKLFITEKPSVAREYATVLGISNKAEGYISGHSAYLNDDIIITWCVGHLISMSYPEKYDENLKLWSLDTIPFLPAKYKYEVIPDVKKQFKIVKDLYSSLTTKDTIYLAGDSGREGIYIQDLVYQHACSNKNIPVLVVWIDSFTESEIKKGIREAKPVSQYKDLIASAYARAIEDYSIGINFSRAISLMYSDQICEAANIRRTAISVGRVMTCVLGMITNREREIRNFVETPFYKIQGDCKTFIANWKPKDNSKFYAPADIYNGVGFYDENKAIAFEKELNKDKHLKITNIKKTVEKKQAPTLFNLAELQSVCSAKFKISPDETLQIAQSLYEKKLTTYPRTDARVVTETVVDNIDTNINGLLAMGIFQQELNYVKSTNYKAIKNQKRYCDNSKVTDHYAIIPTGEGSTNGLSALEKDVFELITKRFIAIFYPPAEYKKTVIDLIHSNGEVFSNSFKTLITKGYLAVYDDKKEDDEEESSVDINYNINDIIDSEFKHIEGKTTPPKRYTSGSIVLAMENAGNLIEDEELRAQIKGSGIGTSATRAETIKKLVEKAFINLNKKTQVLTPTMFGELTYEVVQLCVPKLLSPENTASWEKGLTQVSDGQIDAQVFYNKLFSYIEKNTNLVKTSDFSGVLYKKISDLSSVYTDINTDVVTCPKCNRKLNIYKNGAYGCSGYKTGDCNFYLGNEFCQKKLTDAQIKELLNKKPTKTIKGFKSKAGKTFDARLVLDTDTWRITFYNEK